MDALIFVEWRRSYKRPQALPETDRVNKQWLCFSGAG